MVRYSLSPISSVLVGIDIQRAFGEAIPVPNVDKALVRIRDLLQAWRAAGGRVILTRQTYAAESEVGRLADFLPHAYDVLRDGSPLAEFYDGIAQPDDVVVRKTQFSALQGTDLLARLRNDDIETVQIMGLTTPICVQATVDAISMNGFQVVVAEDACASQPMGELSAVQAHDAAIQRMGYVFAEVAPTEDLIQRFSC